MTTHFHPLQATAAPPEQFNDPFDYEPHPLCAMAARQVSIYINKVEAWQTDLTAGKMLGVLVCRRADGQLGFLAAYSGLLAGRNDWDYFVPPVFDAQQPDGHFKTTERAISAINAEVRMLTEQAATLLPGEKERLLALKRQRKLMSEELQLWLFRQYRVLNARGEVKDLVDIWRDFHSSEKLRAKFPLPPGGTGDCCAPKLLQYAYRQHLRPLCIAEFWQGASPKGEIRHHGQFYPACRGKCKPVLTWMLQGLEVEGTGEAGASGGSETTGANGTAETSGTAGYCGGEWPPVVYRESSFLVINKPAGMLSVPGRTGQPSVESLLRLRYPGTEGPMMVHRLDMETSGLMVVALTPEAYHALQRQFLARTVKKRYVALLKPSPSGMLLLSSNPRGRISLPLRPDPLDRPRQVVDPAGGKEAVTLYEVLSTEGPYPRLALTPLTGRTHQLRMHCAYSEGLDSPILGDALYGQKADRLYLHAEYLAFSHPLTGEPLAFNAPAPF